jgi:ATP-binding cassette subfamily G (WHITE) protein 2 (SNQ2)
VSSVLLDSTWSGTTVFSRYVFDHRSCVSFHAYRDLFQGQYESSRAGYQFAMILITEIFSVLLGQAVAALSPSIFVAALFNPFLLVIFSLFCGVTIPKPTLMPFWRDWLYWLNPLQYLVSGMIATSLWQLPVQCVSTGREA